MHLPVVAELPDGSWLTHINDPRAVSARVHKNAKRRRRGKLPPDTSPLPGLTVRVIEFWVSAAAAGGAVRTERYRLITTVRNWQQAPAADLASGYAWRWAAETGFAEFKTCLRGAGRILRGRTPELARQELWAHLALYQAIRAIICLAAAGAGIDPDRISFTATLHAIRRTIALARTSPAAALAETEAAIMTELIPQRHGRLCVRAVTHPCSPYPSRRNHQGPISQHAQPTITTRRPSHPPHATTDQPKHPHNPQNQPP
jgi:hypothetical protein